MSTIIYLLIGIGIAYICIAAIVFIATALVCYPLALLFSILYILICIFRGICSLYIILKRKLRR